MKRIKTRIPGIRYREHPKRKHGVGLDKYFSIRYRTVDKAGKKITIEEGVGWASEGWTLALVTDTLTELKRNNRTGEGPKTLREKREASEALRKAEESERLRLEEEKAFLEAAEAERLRIENETIFAKIFKHYCKSNAHKKSLKDEQGLAKKWILPFIQEKRLNQITTFDIEKIKHNMLKSGRAIRTVQYAFAIVRQIFNYARDRNLFDGDLPTKFVKLPKNDNRRMRFLSQDEAIALLHELKQRSLTSYRVAKLSLHTGMRFGEIANLKWQHIDLDNRQITIFDPKNRLTRIAFMTEAVSQMFSEMTPENPNDLIFATKDNRRMKQVSDSFMNAVNALNLNEGVEDRRMKVVFHTLRHSCASHLAMAGVDLATIQNILGHKSLAMTERYSHLSNSHVRNAINRLQNTLNPKSAEVINFEDMRPPK